MKRRKVWAALLAGILISSSLATGCTGEDAVDGSAETATDAQQAETQEEAEGFTPHGSEYGKSETVTATTSLSGELDAVVATEWIKNPDELDVIVDETALQGVVADDDMAYEQDGGTITWQADGADVSYTGVSDQQLPFDVEYRYTLDGEPIDADELEDLTGTLEVTITYTNLTSGTVEVDGEDVEVQQPYLMACLIVFDTEHARNVEVDGGSVVEVQGSAVAVGVALPGLAETLGVEDDVELPESVTITAEVAGFDLTSIVTVASNRLLTAFDDETLDAVDEALDDAYGQLDEVMEALDALAEGMAAVDEGIAAVSEGQAALNEAFPNATSGIAALTAVSDGVLSAVDASNEAVEASLAAQAAALEQLQGIDASALTEEQQAAVEAAVESLTEASALDAAAAQGLAGAQTAAGQLSEGLASVEEGLEQIQSGYAQLGDALATVNEATAALSTALSAMDGGVDDALAEARGLLDEKVELAAALEQLVEDAGAWCGNAEDMPASTVFVVTAQAD